MVGYTTDAYVRSRWPFQATELHRMGDDHSVYKQGVDFNNDVLN